MAEATGGAWVAPAVFVASVALLALKPVLLHVAQEAGESPLDPRFFFLCAELLKVGLCSAALLWRYVMVGPASARIWCGARHTVSFIIPAWIYLVMNWTTVYANSILRPATFQLLVNVKIMTTALAGWVVLSRRLPGPRWAALVMLTCSTILGQWGAGPSGGSHHDSKLLLSGEATCWGFFVVFICALLSGLGAVCTERLLKARSSQDLSIYATNVHMAGHTLVLNIAALALRLNSSGSISSGMVLLLPSRRQAGWVLLAVVNEAINGILMSTIMRLADSNAKNYAFSISVFLVAGLSAAVFGYWPQPGFFVGAAMVVVSLALYARAAPAAVKKTS